MNRKTILAATMLVTTAFGSAAFAETHHGHKGQPGSDDQSSMMTHGGSAGMMGNMDAMSGMMGMMQNMHANMMGDGMKGGMGPMGSGTMMMFDADGDGTVTPEELRGQLQAKLTEYDNDGNGALSIAEFETLHGAMVREMMVDRFQDLDADGDGAVTSDEMAAPADKMERMQMMRTNQDMDGGTMLKNN